MTKNADRLRTGDKLRITDEPQEARVASVSGNFITVRWQSNAVDILDKSSPLWNKLLVKREPR